MPEKRIGIEPFNVMEFIDENIIPAISLLQKRVGMNLNSFSKIDKDVVTPNDVYNKIRMINTELIALKVNLGINERINKKKKDDVEKNPSDVYQLLEYINLIIKEWVK